jgi:putative endonuclease
MTEAYYLYILQSQSNDTYYVGVSRDPETRIKQHNQGVTKSTAHKGPWELKFSQIYENGRAAKKAEHWLKRMKSKAIIEKIIKDGYIAKCT